MIWITSGLPRSGTSMMMQMVEKAGIPILMDTTRAADESNPKGYFEYDPVNRLKQDNSWIENADGKAVKIISVFLEELPAHLDYGIIFMERDIDSILESQRKMLSRQGLKSPADQSLLKATFSSQLARTKTFLKSQGNMQVAYFNYETVLERPKAAAERLVNFLGTGRAIDIAAAVEPDLRTVLSK